MVIKKLSRSESAEVLLLIGCFLLLVGSAISIGLGYGLIATGALLISIAILGATRGDE